MSKFPKTTRFLNHLNHQNFSVNKEKASELLNDGFSIFTHVMPRLHSEVTLYYKLEQREELMIKQLFYQTSLKDDELAMLDAYVTICQDRPLEAIDRLTSKEIDFYLRDDMKVSSFDYYPNKLFDFLAIGESLKKLQVEEVKITPLLDVEKFGKFQNLSCSEQFELIEDILGEYVFSKYPELGGKLICDEINDNFILFDTSQLSLSQKLIDDITQVLCFHLQNPDLLIQF